MILLVNVCKEELHQLEFVFPIEQILKQKGIAYSVVNYQKLKSFNLKKYTSIIICGTSLKDNDYLKLIDSFRWIKEFNKPILGICAGMQIIALVYNSKKRVKTEIGFYNENFTKEFLGLNKKNQVYHLHNNYITLPNEFDSFTSSVIPQAIKHKTKPIYGVLFHPEVRNKNLIEEFLKI